MARPTDDERRLAAERLRWLAASDLPPWVGYTYEAVMGYVPKVGEGSVYQESSYKEYVSRLADLIEPAPTISDSAPTSVPTERGIDSIYDWCFAAIEGADGAEDELYCSIMRAIEDYRHPKCVNARTARPVDREALLALADELEEGDVTYLVSTQYVLDSFASRIREACGEARDGD